MVLLSLSEFGILYLILIVLLILGLFISFIIFMIMRNFKENKKGYTKSFYRFIILFSLCILIIPWILFIVSNLTSSSWIIIWSLIFILGLIGIFSYKIIADYAYYEMKAEVFENIYRIIGFILLVVGLIGLVYTIFSLYI